MDLKKAIFISFIGHCFVLSPLGSLWFLATDKKANDVQIIYYKLPIQASEAIKTTQAPKKEKPSPKTDSPQPTVQPLIRETLTIEKPKKERPPKIKENIIPASIPGTTLPNTPECVNYYQYIREEIRRYLKKHYTNEYEEGEVGVSFVLTHIGEVINLSVIEEKSSNDPELRKFSYESIRGAAPFRPFPKNLSSRQISFNLTIVYRHR